jgi:hypothetical protein
MHTYSTEIYKTATGVADTNTTESAWIIVLLIGFVLLTNIFLISQWKDSRLSKIPNSSSRLIVRSDARHVNSVVLNRPSSLLLTSLALHHPNFNKEHNSHLYNHVSLLQSK